MSLVWPGMSNTRLTRSVDLPEAADPDDLFAGAGAGAFFGAGFFSPADCKH